MFGEVHEVARLASSMTDSRRTDSVLQEFDARLHYAVLPLSIGRRGAMQLKRNLKKTSSTWYVVTLYKEIFQRSLRR